jgi:osmotically inducible protein OsmC
MPDFHRTATAEWLGDLQTGEGKTTTGSGGVSALSYSVRSRFGNGRGTNPEELIASAHASCFSMMLSKILTDQGKPPTRISTKANLTLHQDNRGVKITTIHLVTEGTVEGLDREEFRRAAEQAKEQCPVSKLLKPGLESISLEANLAP